MINHKKFFRLPLRKMLQYADEHSIVPLTPIDSQEISVVVQGPIFSKTSRHAPEGITKQVIKALRQHLPQATIIVSTWKNQPIGGLDADLILQLEDPGTTHFYRQNAKADNLYNNGNRLITSTQQGLAQVKTKYALKIRSDLLLFHPLFSSYFYHFKYRDPQWQILSERIMAFPIYSLKFECSRKIKQYRPFHISDWAYFGLTEDLNTLFACPLMPEPDTSRWFETRAKPANDLWPDRLWRYSPEQYIISNLAQRTRDMTLAHGSQDDAEILQASEQLIVNNFLIIDQWQWGFWSLKLKNYQDNLIKVIQAGLYTHQVWLNDYKHYCLPAKKHEHERFEAEA